MEFDAKGNLYVADFANGDILKFRPPFNSGSVPTRTFYVCGGMGAGCGLNAITFDKAGNLYVSDSFGGDIFRIGTDGKVITFIDGDAEDAQGKKIYDDLKPGSHGFPPFGANGLAFDAKEDNLYIANTADDRILKYNLASNTLTRFAESINGATFSPIPAPPHEAVASVVTAASVSAPSTGAKKSGRSVVTRTVTNPAGALQLGKKVGYPETRSLPLSLATV